MEETKIEGKKIKKTTTICVMKEDLEVFRKAKIVYEMRKQNKLSDKAYFTVLVKESCLNIPTIEPKKEVIA